MAIQDVLHTLSDRLHSSADVQKVFGPAIAAEGKTIIPVARVAYGFGGGSGAAGKKITETLQPAGEGGGGGGGVAVAPVGVFEVSSSGTRFVPLTDKRRLAISAVAGVGLGLLLAARRRK